MDKAFCLLGVYPLEEEVLPLPERAVVATDGYVGRIRGQRVAVGGSYVIVGIPHKNEVHLRVHLARSTLPTWEEITSRVTPPS